MYKADPLVLSYEIKVNSMNIKLKAERLETAVLHTELLQIIINIHII